MKARGTQKFKVGIVFLFSMLIIPTVLLISAITYYKTSRTALDMAKSHVEQMMGAAIEKTTDYLHMAQVLAVLSSHVLKNPKIEMALDSDLEDYLLSVVVTQPQIDLFNYGNENGDYIQAFNLGGQLGTRLVDRRGDRPVEYLRYFNDSLEFTHKETNLNVTFDPRIRPWYEGAKNTRSTFWTDLYIFFENKKPGLTAASPVIDGDGKFLGVVAADITLGGLSEFLKEIKISANSIVFIMDRNKQLVAFPEPDRMVALKDGVIRPLQPSELNSEWITAATRKYEDTKITRFAYNAGGREYLAFFTPFPKSFGKEWTIVALLPEDDFLKGARETNLLILVVSTVILVIAVFLGMLFAKNLSRPIELLTDEVEKIHHFELDGKIKISSRISEIQKMSDAVESMKSGLQAFKRYVPADLVRQLIESGEEVKPGGSEKEITLFFSDIESFTTISEKTSPKELMILLSDYLDIMNSIIAEEKGTVDKFIGDAVMAFWGAPIKNENHAVNACRAALRCQRSIAKLNEKLVAGDNPPLHTRIGIHTGFTIVGNMGSEERLNYTVIGDNVNLASRLEGVNKLYGTSVIISQDTFRYVRKFFMTRPLDIIAVKGKVNSVQIFELMGEKNSEFAGELEELSLDFARAFELYLKRKWEDAISILEVLAGKFPDDKPVAIYLDRCGRYSENAPDPDWSGVVRLDSK